MMRVVVVDWRGEVAGERLREIQAAACDAEVVCPDGMEFLKRLQANPPDALVIDLTRLPAQGRDLALALRQRKGTRHIPLVMAGGEEAKVSHFRAVLPDVVFAAWAEIGVAVRTAIDRQPAQPAVPSSLFDAYRGKPVASKLGIKEGTRLTLFAEPEGFLGLLGELPAHVALVAEGAGAFDVGLWFVRSRAELDQGMEAMAARLVQGSLWVAWAKQGSPLATDLTQADVRRIGLAAGLVDYKICAIDDDWSGLLFTRRRAAGRKGRAGQPPGAKP